MKGFQQDAFNNLGIGKVLIFFGIKGQLKKQIGSNGKGRLERIGERSKLLDQICDGSRIEGLLTPVTGQLSLDVDNDAPAFHPLLESRENPAFQRLPLPRQGYDGIQVLAVQ